MAEVDHRRLREAPDHLVGARDHEVGAQAERAAPAAPRGRRGARPRPRPPRAARRARGPPPRAPPRRPPRRSRWARPPSPPPHPASPAARASSASGVMQCAMCSSGSSSGRDERRPQPGHDQRVDRARVGVPLRHHVLPAVGERQQRHMVALRRPVHEPPRAPRAPGLGRQPLRLLERRRLVAHVDPVGERRDVEREHALADRLHQAGVRARPRPCARARGSGPGLRAAYARSASRYGVSCWPAKRPRESRW